MSKIFFLSVSNVIDQASFKCLLSYISREKQTYIMRLHFDIDKKLSLYAELLVRIIACQTFCIDNTEIEFEKSEFGKPFIKGHPKFHYNIAHTRSAVVLGVSDNAIGIDIEMIRNAELKIADRFFASPEQYYINELRNQANKRFYEVWTKKEAYIKCSGKGLSIPLNSFNTLDNAMSERIWTFEKDGYLISICNSFYQTEYELIEISENQVNSMAIKLL